MALKLIVQEPVQISGYKTSDGCMFEDIRAANAHEVSEALRVFCGEKLCNESSQDDVAEFIIRNAAALHAALGRMA